MFEPQPLTDLDREIYAWQMWMPGVGEEGQRKLKGASVMISRCGGVGGQAAYQLAAAGVGRLILAHGGNVRPSDLNRQLLQTYDHLGKPRIESIRARLLELNPHIDIVTADQNINAENAAALVEQADILIDAAPLFEERFELNRQSVLQGKPMVECAMYETELHLTVFRPRNPRNPQKYSPTPVPTIPEGEPESPCLACLYPENPAHWKRQFPVFGAVAGTVGAMAAFEAIKLITGIGSPLVGKLAVLDMANYQMRLLNIQRAPNCPICG